MSSVCRNKDAAWEYIRGLLEPRVSKSHPLTTFMNIPVSTHDFQLLLWGEIRQQQRVLKGIPDDPEILRRTLEPLLGTKHFTHGPQVNMLHLLTEEDTERYKKLIGHTTQLYWPEDELSDIIWETLGPYFAGDKTMDQVINLLQNRVQLYLNEAK